MIKDSDKGNERKWRPHLEKALDASDLTPRQRAILDFIVERVQARGFTPAVREIGEAVGLSSPSTVHAHLGTLQEKGFLQRDPTKPRAIEVHWGKKAEAPPAGDNGAEHLPVYGRIAAGPALLADQPMEGTLAFPKEFISDTPHFVVTVSGDSMIEAGILDGDMVVVRSQHDAANGDIVAAQMTGPTGEAEATVKRFQRQGSRILLVPANSAMAPIEAPEDLKILGRVVALLRRF